MTAFLLRWAPRVAWCALLVATACTSQPYATSSQGKSQGSGDTDKPAASAAAADASAPPAAPPASAAKPTATTDASAPSSPTDAGPAPVLTSLDPTSIPVAATADDSVALVVTGSGFDDACVVVFDGVDLSTKSLDAARLQGSVPTSLLQVPRTVSVSVHCGGRASISLSLIVAVAASAPPPAPAPGACAVTCAEWFLAPGQCVQTGDDDDDDGFFFGWFGTTGQTTFQCGADGCIQGGCN